METLCLTCKAWLRRAVRRLAAKHGGNQNRKFREKVVRVPRWANQKFTRRESHQRRKDAARARQTRLAEAKKWEGRYA